MPFAKFTINLCKAGSIRKLCNIISMLQMKLRLKTSSWGIVNLHVVVSGVKRLISKGIPKTPAET
jgi:hypothetical protein